MPPYDPVHIAVNRANPARKRVVSDVASKQPNKAKQKRQPHEDQQLPRRRDAVPAAEAERATGASGLAGSDTSRDGKRAADPADADPAAPPPKRRCDRQCGLRGAVSGAAASMASGGAQRPQGAINGDPAADAAAAWYGIVRATGRMVKDLCAEAERFSGVHWECDADGTLGSWTSEPDSRMVTELHELQERLDDALHSPALTDSMFRRIMDSCKVLRTMNKDLMEDEELCTRPGCWHIPVESDTDYWSDSDDQFSEEDASWAQPGCARDNPDWY